MKVRKRDKVAVQVRDFAEAVETENLKIGYNDNIVVESLNMKIEKGKVTSIIGANGCGKSTILKAIGRIIKKKSGSVYINGYDIDYQKSKEIAKQVAILSQISVAPATITCYELVSYGRFPYQKGFGMMSQEDRTIVNWALESTNLTPFKDRSIGSLSGGQRQRVWIAMALAQNGNIILLDEPTTYLDLSCQLEILELLLKLNRENGTTIVMVLHDLNLAAKYSDNLIAIKDGEIFKSGRTEEVLTEEMLNKCFGVSAEIITDKESGKPLCFNFKLMKEEKVENDSEQ